LLEGPYRRADWSQDQRQARFWKHVHSEDETGGVHAVVLSAVVGHKSVEHASEVCTTARTSKRFVTHWLWWASSCCQTCYQVRFRTAK